MMSRPDHHGYDPFDSSPSQSGGEYRGGFDASSYGNHSRGADEHEPDGAPGGGSGGAGYEGLGYGAPGVDRAPGPYGAGGAAPTVPTGSGFAIAALIFGVLSVPSAFLMIGALLALIGIALAIVALVKGAKARKLGAQTTGTTVMSVLAILSALIGLVIGAFVIFIMWTGMNAGTECQHLVGDQAAFEECIENQVLEDWGLN